MVEALEPGQLNTETLGVVTQYSDDVKIEVNQKFHSDLSQFSSKVNRINQMAMGTNTFTALAYVANHVLPR